MLKHSILICALLAVSSPSFSDTIISKSSPNSSGVNIASGGWNAANHADATYREFAKAHEGPLGRYDFYYSLEIVPQFRDKYTDCTNNPNFKNFFSSLFGVSSGVLVAVKADIQHRWTSGTSVDLLKGDSLLVLAARGASSSSPTAGNGCFFDQTLRPTFPLIQWGGGRESDFYDDFVVKFIVVGGKTERLNLIANVVSLFSEVSASAGWSAVTAGIAAPAAQASIKAASNFQSALQEAGTLQNQISASFTLESNPSSDDGRIVITIPGLFGGDEKNGSMAIFVRRQGSIALQGSGPIDVSSVFDNVQLANRQCNNNQIAAGTCNVSGNNLTNDTIRIALAKYLKDIPENAVGSGTNPIGALFDVDQHPKGIYGTCKGIRTVARLNLHLSTLDEMMLRWAFTKEGGVQAAIEAADKDATKRDIFEKATGRSLDDIKSMCWNAGDKKILEAVAKGLERPIK